MRDGPGRRALPLAAVAASLASQNLGAAWAKTLFAQVGADGATALRVGLAALLLAAFRRPWRYGPVRGRVADLAGYGAALGGMNLCIYHAFERIPIGIATAIEVTGPLALVLAGSRRAADLAWIALAIAGLVLLPPWRASAGAGGAAFDPIGVLFAFGAAAAWALYIVYGKRVSGLAAGQAVPLGMAVAALVTVPIGIARAGAALAAPGVALAGLGVALLSSAMPYSFEMAALRRLPRRLFGILSSVTPAAGAFFGWLVLGERLEPAQWLGIVAVIAACAGAAARSDAR
jgi:inner membrane transporter RhtA